MMLRDMGEPRAKRECRASEGRETSGEGATSNSEATPSLLAPHPCFTMDIGKRR
jgi:hypothetical protein